MKPKIEVIDGRPVVKCPKCGEYTPWDSTVCVKCGKVIRKIK